PVVWPAMNPSPWSSVLSTPNKATRGPVLSRIPCHFPNRSANPAIRSQCHAESRTSEAASPEITSGESSVQQPHLPKHRRLIPVAALTRDLVASELDDHDNVDIHLLVGRRHAGEEPLHRPVVGERRADLVHKLVVAYDPVRRRLDQVVGPRGDEDVPIEGAE